jgi:hypothetical protein
VIVHCNFEELTALKAGAHQVLDGYAPEHGMIAAPPEERERVAALMPRLGGDFSVTTLTEQRSLLQAVTIIVGILRIEMESMVAAHHPADEFAVSAYFDFAHAFSVQGRLYEVGLEMEALVELVTGGPVTEDLARDFVFPD